MIDKTKLLALVRKLQKSAQNRKTNQGVKIYQGALEKIEKASTQIEIDALARKLNHALAGIEAHGHFTSEEFKVVKCIRSICSSSKPDLKG